MKNTLPRAVLFVAGLKRGRRPGVPRRTRRPLHRALAEGRAAGDPAAGPRRRRAAQRHNGVAGAADAADNILVQPATRLFQPGAVVHVTIHTHTDSPEFDHVTVSLQCLDTTSVLIRPLYNNTIKI